MGMATEVCFEYVHSICAALVMVPEFSGMIKILEEALLALFVCHDEPHVPEFAVVIVVIKLGWIRFCLVRSQQVKG